MTLSAALPWLPKMCRNTLFSGLRLMWVSRRDWKGLYVGESRYVTVYQAK